LIPIFVRPTALPRAHPLEQVGAQQVGAQQDRREKEAKVSALGSKQ